LAGGLFHEVCEVVNLGDHVSGPLEAARTADILMERGFPSVLVDQDRRLVELCTDGASSRSDFRQLERKHFDWMASMPPTLEGLVVQRVALVAIILAVSRAGLPNVD
jgi:hypothetical protein